MGIVRRLLGKDSLHLKLKPNLKGYWIDRTPAGPKLGSMKKILVKYGVDMSFLNEFWGFLLERKKFFLWPIIIALLLIGGIIVISQGHAVAPFVYAIF
jgi:hypothetical protein